MKPVIRRASRVLGRTLVFRDVTPSDTNFITALRTDGRKSRFLSYTPPDPEAQHRWLVEYANTGGQAYFIIEDMSGEALGTIRLYDAVEYSFCWGSWILKDDCASGAAMESALMAYDLGINHLGFSAAHFDVRKKNEKVWRFHERFGAVRIREDNLDYFYTISKTAITQSLKKYNRFLTDTVKIEWL